MNKVNYRDYLFNIIKKFYLILTENQILQIRETISSVTNRNSSRTGRANSNQDLGNFSPYSQLANSN